MKDIQDYINDANARFDGRARQLVLQQIELFYKEEKCEYTRYREGQEVLLTKHHFMHGIPGGLDSFMHVAKDGIVALDFTEPTKTNKIKNSVGVWKFGEDIKLCEYIRLYSGFTITYTIGRGPGSTHVCRLVPYHGFDEFTERINSDESIWTYWGEKTKESTFLPSLVSNKRQFAFILNMTSTCAVTMAQNDVWNREIDDEVIEPFLDYRFYPKFLDIRKNPDASDTDREGAIMFGLPPRFIEGVFVGEKTAKDKKCLEIILQTLPGRYICDLSGRVIAGNN